MSMKESAALRAVRRAACRTFALAVFSCMFMGFSAVPAYADGGVSFVGAWPEELDSVSPAPALAYTLSLQFDKNVGYDNAGTGDGFIQENTQKVHVLDDQGNEVEGIIVRPGSSREERQLLYVQATEWLKPLTTYTVRIDEGIQAANGTDVSTQAYEVQFTTSAECPDGLNVYQNILIPGSIIVVVGGVVAATIRTRKERR